MYNLCFYITYIAAYVKCPPRLYRTMISAKEIYKTILFSFYSMMLFSLFVSHWIHKLDRPSIFTS